MALREGAARLAAAGVTSAEFDVGLLFRAAAGWSAAELIARVGDTLSPAVGNAFHRLVSERATRRPLQQVLGRVEFFGLSLVVGPGALIPRPDTETLVEAALARFSSTGGAPRIADVGCGSGAVALALASHLPAARIVALDNSRAALAVAAENLRRCALGHRVCLSAGDLLSSVGTATLDGAVANLPYIPDAEIETLEPEVRDHEPRSALAGGPDGLDPLRRLAPMAARAVRPGGAVFVEIGAGQERTASRVLEGAGLGPVDATPDLNGIPRVLAAAIGPRGKR